MSVEKDKAQPGSPGGKPAARTVVGVPAIPSDRPSDAALTSELPARAADEDEQPTAIDMKAVTANEAERVLSERPPGVAGAVSPRAPGAGPVKTPPLVGEMFRGLPRPAAGARIETETKTRAGVAPQPGTASRGRSTLLLDGSAPPAPPSDSSVDNPPIVVPASGATPPKAVTQPPPWGEGAAHAASGIPHHVPPMRSREPSVEEISASMLLPADASGSLLATAAEELSGSVLIEDAPDGSGPRVTKSPAPAPVKPKGSPSVKPPVPRSSSAPGRPASVKPPVPKSPSGRPGAHAQRALLGMPELPKTTPGPDLEALHAANVARAPSVPPPLPPHAVEPMAIPPPPAFVSEAVEGGAPPLYTQPLPTLAVGQPTPLDAQGAPLEVPGVPPPPTALSAPAEPVPPAPPTVPEAPLGGGSNYPSAAPMTGDIELTRLPRNPLERALDEVRRGTRDLTTWLESQNLLRPGARPPWFLPVVATGGLVIGIGLVGLMVSVARSATHASDAPSASSGTASSRPMPTASAAPDTSSQSPAPPPPTPLAACTVTGVSHVIGPSATVVAGVEAAVSGSDIALAFAPDDHDAMAVRVDPSQLTVGSAAHAHSRDVIRRATPLLGKGGLTLAVDTDRKGDKLQGRRTIRSSPPVQIGATADGQLSWTKLGGTSAVPLWAIGGTTPTIDALRGTVDGFGDPTIAIAFRSGSAVYMGTIAGTGGLAPVGPLSHVDGLGTAIGSPAVAVSSSVVLVAWADRASSDAPWKLRWTRLSAGATPDPPTEFVPPAGGKGEPFMSPSLAAVPGGRFLMVWTEGPASGHVVRALTLGADGVPVGAPLELSPDGANAGQAQAAIGDTGDGVVAFLESGGKGFQVAATSIHCGVP